jgi:hypothetical protein
VETIKNSFGRDEDDEPEDKEFNMSALDYKGDLRNIPIRMMFGIEGCGAVFNLPSNNNNGAVFRVCGCYVESCKRGHQASWLTNWAKPGSYETV